MHSIYSSNFQSKLITFGIIYSRKQRSFLTVKPKPFFSFTIFISLSFLLSDTSHSSIRTLSYSLVIRCSAHLFLIIIKHIFVEGVEGGNGCGKGSNQLNNPICLSFDVENNLYVVDWGNDRIQRFSVDNKD